MKDLFPGHFRDSDDNLAETWNECLFVFDTNILLNLYRYSDSTKEEFLKILKKIGSRIWLPHRAADEYFNNRLEVIGKQEKAYDDTVSNINKLKKELDNARQHPFVSKEVMGKIEGVFDELCSELADNKKVHTSRISNDEIKESIASIFLGKVGPPYDKAKLEEIVVNGEERYKQKIPPGFKDSSKSTGSEIFTEICRKYGDLIIWNQVIDKSIEAKKPVVFVIDDRKEDWWSRFNGKTIGPRPELVAEFRERTKQSFHMYQADRFLELARELLEEEVSDELVDEIRKLRELVKLNEKEADRLEREVSAIESIEMEIDFQKSHISELNYKLKYFTEQLKRIEGEQLEFKDTYHHKNIDMNDSATVERMMSHYSVLDKEKKNIEKELVSSSHEYQNCKDHLNSLEAKLSNMLT